MNTDIEVRFDERLWNSAQSDLIADVTPETWLWQDDGSEVKILRTFDDESFVFAIFEQGLKDMVCVATGETKTQDRNVVYFLAVSKTMEAWRKEKEKREVKQKMKNNSAFRDMVMNLKSVSYWPLSDSYTYPTVY